VSLANPLHLAVDPAFEPWLAEPGELTHSLSVAARATAQTRRRLRAGHRAELVALHVPLPSPRTLHRLVIRPILFQFVPRASTDRCHRRGCTAGTLLLHN
jgi:hypothetical protein